jgi:hypothetical protein
MANPVIITPYLHASTEGQSDQNNRTHEEITETLLWERDSAQARIATETITEELSSEDHALFCYILGDEYR